MDTLFTTRLFKNDKNSLCLRNSSNTLMEDQENEFDDFAHTTIDDANENQYVSTSTEESISN